MDEPTLRMELPGLHIRCPHCHNAVRIVGNQSTTDVECANCGSVFTLVDDDATLASFEQGALLGHFQLIERLGRGAFGVVWKALDTQLDRLVAIKLPGRADVSSQLLESFVREARTASQLSHPNVAAVYEVGKLKGSIYIVSEFVDGPTLRAWTKLRPLPQRESAQFCRKVALALQHAHERGVIHRDLKPSNVLVTAEMEPKVVDFGLARREAGEITITIDGAILGSPDYMPPEQAWGKAHEADARSDIYSLGVMLYELVTGNVPFRGDKSMLIHQIKHEPPPHPRKLKADVSSELCTIVLKCLEKEPEARYQTAAELAEELARYLAGEPIQARPISSFERVWRWAKRKPSAASLAAVSLLFTLSLAVGGPFIAWQQAQLAAQQTEQNALLVAAQEQQREADRKRLQAQAQLLDQVGPEGVEILEMAFAAEAELAIPILRNQFEASNSPLEQSRLRTILLGLTDEVSDALVQELLTDAAEQSNGEGARVLGALLALPDRPQLITATEQLLQAADAGAPQVPAQTNSQARSRWLVVLAHLGAFEALQAQLQSDNSSYDQAYDFIDEFGAFHGDLQLCAQRLSSIEQDALAGWMCLALGQVPRASLAESVVEQVLSSARDWYLDRAYRQRHSAAEWLLEQWQASTALAATPPAAQDQWYRNAQGLTMLRIPPGTVTLGSGAEDLNYPIQVMEAEVSNAYWLASTEVPLRTFQTYWNNAEEGASSEREWSTQDAPSQPVRGVTLDQIAGFCNWLSRQEGHTECYEITNQFRELDDPLYESTPPVPIINFDNAADGYRLPSFAEWEWACRGQSTTAYFFGDADDLARLDAFATFSLSSWRNGAMSTSPCGSRMPNPNGLFDILGNVGEYTQEPPYGAEPVLLPVRGGSYDQAYQFCLSGSYYQYFVSSPSPKIGFRVARNLSAAEAEQP